MVFKLAISRHLRNNHNYERNTNKISKNHTNSEILFKSKG
jgi:hypothetical protein